MGWNAPSPPVIAWLVAWLRHRMARLCTQPDQMGAIGQFVFHNDRLRAECPA